MGLIFALAVAAQIHTGQDLIDACRERDKTACDQFILHALQTGEEASCLPASLRQPAMRRRLARHIVDEERLSAAPGTKWPDRYGLQFDAREFFFYQTTGLGCSYDSLGEGD